MRGTSLVVTACLTHAVISGGPLAAAAAPPPKRVVVTTCDLPKCQGVQDAAGCIGPLIALGGGVVEQLAGCVPNGGTSLICSCGGCVKGLADFLNDNAVC